MQVIINQTQIENAIIAFMHKRINLAEGTKLVIEMKATRGAEGFSAVVDIVDSEEQAEREQEKARVTAAKEAKLEGASRFLQRAKASVDEPVKEEAEQEAEEVEAAPVVEDGEAEAPTTKPKSIFNNVVKA